MPASGVYMYAYVYSQEEYSDRLAILRKFSLHSTMPLLNIFLSDRSSDAYIIM